MQKCLILYFSREGENYVNGKVVKLEKGNTKRVVEMISSIVDCDLFQVERVIAQSENEKECVKQAMKDDQQVARPVLKHVIKDVSSYKTIVLAGPIRW